MKMFSSSTAGWPTPAYDYGAPRRYPRSAEGWYGVSFPAANLCIEASGGPLSFLLVPPPGRRDEVWAGHPGAPAERRGDPVDAADHTRLPGRSRRPDPSREGVHGGGRDAPRIERGESSDPGV